MNKLESVEQNIDKMLDGAHAIYAGFMENMNDVTADTAAEDVKESANNFGVDASKDYLVAGGAEVRALRSFPRRRLEHTSILTGRWSREP